MFHALRRSLPAAALLGGMVVVSATTGAVAAGMITGADIKNGTVTGKDLKDSSVSPADLNAAAKKGRVTGLQLVTDTLSITAGNHGFINMSCPSGKSVLSATADWATAYAATSGNIKVTLDGAYVYGENTTGSTDTLRGYLVCATIS